MSDIRIGQLWADKGNKGLPQCHWRVHNVNCHYVWYYLDMHMSAIDAIMCKLTRKDFLEGKTLVRDVEMKLPELNSIWAHCLRSVDNKFYVDKIIYRGSDALTIYMRSLDKGDILTYSHEQFAKLFKPLVKETIRMNKTDAIDAPEIDSEWEDKNSNILQIYTVLNVYHPEKGDILSWIVRTNDYSGQLYSRTEWFDKFKPYVKKVPMIDQRWRNKHTTNVFVDIKDRSMAWNGSDSMVTFSYVGKKSTFTCTVEVFIRDFDYENG